MTHSQCRAFRIRCQGAAALELGRRARARVLDLHRDAAEAFFVLEGEYLMYVENRQQLGGHHRGVQLHHLKAAVEQWPPPTR